MVLVYKCGQKKLNNCRGALWLYTDFLLWDLVFSEAGEGEEIS